MRTLMISVVLLTLVAGLTACNTMAGAGEDMQAGGQKLQDSAEKNK